MKKKIVYWLCERGLLKIARRISPSLVSMWQGEQLAKKIGENINLVMETMANFARMLQKAWELQSAEDNNSHNFRFADENKE